MNREKYSVVGKRFGRLIAIERAYGIKKGTIYRCKCDCGNETYVSKNHLVDGNTKSCGCLERELKSKRFLKDLTGKRFGQLLVVKRAKNKIQGGQKKTAWICKCDCGNKIIVTGENLKNKITKSCGCLRGENHHMRNTRLYSIYTNMKTRCKNNNSSTYRYYGERGINVCEEWDNSFSVFMDWAIKNGYNDNLTLDRINVNDGYNPSNCRWVTIEMQANNKRNNIYYTYMGETHTIAEWAKILPISKKNVYQRIERGKSIQYAFGKEIERLKAEGNK